MENKEEIKKEELENTLKTMMDVFCKDKHWYDYTCLESLEDVVERVFDNYFDLVEGWICSHDKSAYVTRRLLESVKNKETYSLKMTYRESTHKDRFKEDELDEVCYWCPVTIDTTEEAEDIFSRMINPRCVAKLLEEKMALYKERTKEENQ